MEVARLGVDWPFSEALYLEVSRALGLIPKVWKEETGDFPPIELEWQILDHLYGDRYPGEPFIFNEDYREELA